MERSEYFARLWKDAKRKEEDAIAQRRAIENDLIDSLELPDNFEGTDSLMFDDVKVKVTGRITRKIDSDMLQAIAIEHGTADHLSRLFRWKPEINIKEWKAADERITAPLTKAITAKPARPSINVELR